MARMLVRRGSPRRAPAHAPAGTRATKQDLDAAQSQAVAAAMTANLASARAEAEFDSQRAVEAQAARSAQLTMPRRGRELADAAAAAQQTCADIMSRSTQKPVLGGDIIRAARELMLELSSALLISGAVVFDTAALGQGVETAVLRHVDSFMGWVQSRFLDSINSADHGPELRAEVSALNKQIDMLVNGGDLRKFVSALSPCAPLEPGTDPWKVHTGHSKHPCQQPQQKLRPSQPATAPPRTIPAPTLAHSQQPVVVKNPATVRPSPHPDSSRLGKRPVAPKTTAKRRAQSASRGRRRNSVATTTASGLGTAHQGTSGAAAAAAAAAACRASVKAVKPQAFTALQTQSRHQKAAVAAEEVLAAKEQVQTEQFDQPHEPPAQQPPPPPPPQQQPGSEPEPQPHTEEQTIAAGFTSLGMQSNAGEVRASENESRHSCLRQLTAVSDEIMGTRLVGSVSAIATTAAVESNRLSKSEFLVSICVREAVRSDQGCTCTSQTQGNVISNDTQSAESDLAGKTQTETAPAAGGRVAAVRKAQRVAARQPLKTKKVLSTATPAAGTAAFSELPALPYISLALTGGT